jgi:hypothetical protein
MCKFLKKITKYVYYIIIFAYQIAHNLQYIYVTSNTIIIIIKINTVHRSIMLNFYLVIICKPAATRHRCNVGCVKVGADFMTSLTASHVTFMLYSRSIHTKKKISSVHHFYYKQVK